MKEKFAILITMFACLVITCLNNSAFSAGKPDPKKGQKVFSAMQCEICHVNLGNNLNPERPLKGPNFIKRFPTDKALAQLIRIGVNERGMPAFGKDKMSDEDLANLISYLRSATPQGSSSSKKEKQIK